MVKKGPSSGKELDRTKHDPEFEFAQTRTASSNDGDISKDNADPGEILGLGKIGVTPKKDVGEEGPEDDDAGVQGATAPTGTGVNLSSIPPLQKIPDMKEEDGSTEGSKDSESNVPFDPEGEDEKVELEEVTIGGGGRKVKIMRVRPSMVPPGPEEGDDDVDPDGPIDPSLGKVKGDKPLKKGTIRRRAGLGMNVVLDKEAIKKFSAPILPRNYSYPSRAFHRQFRRGVLMLILPAIMYFIIFVYLEFNPFATLAVSFILILVIVYLVIYGISPFYTQHSVTKSSVLLEQGVYFKANVPLSTIKGIKTTRERVTRQGVYRRPGGKLFILSHKEGLVKMELRDQLKVGSFKRIKTIMFNVDDASSLVHTVRSAIEYNKGSDQGIEENLGT